MYDVLILCANKDKNKLPYVVDSLKYLTPSYDKLVIISQSKVDIDCKNILDEELTTDKTLLKIDNVNWIYQQLNKLLQKFTRANWLVIDADTIITRELTVFKNDKFNLFYDPTNNQNHEPYFRFSSLYGIEKTFPYSFINEIMVFNRILVREMFQNETYAQIAEKISNDTYISEYEMYGNYLVKNDYFDVYELTEIKSNRQGKYSEWSQREIEAVISASKDYDLCTVHSWIPS